MDATVCVARTASGSTELPHAEQKRLLAEISVSHFGHCGMWGLQCFYDRTGNRV